MSYRTPIESHTIMKLSLINNMKTGRCYRLVYVWKYKRKECMKPMDVIALLCTWFSTYYDNRVVLYLEFFKNVQRMLNKLSNSMWVWTLKELLSSSTSGDENTLGISGVAAMEIAVLYKGKKCWVVSYFQWHVLSTNR